MGNFWLILQNLITFFFVKSIIIIYLYPLYPTLEALVFKRIKNK